MTLWPLLLLLGVTVHGTIGYEVIRGHYISRITTNRTLKSIVPMIITDYLSYSINLSGLKIQKINKGVFKELHFVRKLNLTNNEIKALPPLIFVNMTSLRSLLLSENRIFRLNRNFVGLSRLATLDLSNNQLSSLKKMDLLGLGKSTRILLNGNPLKSLRTGNGPLELWENPWNNQPLYDMKSVDFMNEKSILPVWADLTHPPFYAKLCKAGHLVLAVSIALKGQSPTFCSEVKGSSWSWDLNLSGLGLKGFQRGWFALSKGYYRTLNLSSNSITVITPKLLNGLPEYLTVVDLRNNSINLINNIENRFLKKLILDHNSISDFRDALKNTNLTSISAEYNYLTSTDFARSLPKSIEELMLKGNKISAIGENHLGSLKVLKHLIMPFNQISRLEARVFRGLEELRVIDLSNNLLESIEPGMFEDQGSLSALLLSGNFIKELKPGSFRGLRMVETVELERNRIRRIYKESFAGLRDSIIYKIMLSDNEIEALEKGSFANMTVEMLFLDGNRISEKSIGKGAFELCRVKWMSLARNSFKDINGDAFYGIIVDHSISFYGNNLKRIKGGATRYMGGIKKLNLKGTGVELLENGALYGLKGPNARITVDGIKAIRGGVFEENGGKNGERKKIPFS